MNLVFPKNVAEEITNVTLAKGAGITSVKTASGEIPFNNAREYERIKEEEAEKAKIESEKIKQELKSANSQTYHLIRSTTD